MRPTDITYRPDIDGLRACAVLAIVGFHAMPELINGGFVGVDIFFVISGFLITSIIVRSVEDGSFSFWHFYARRIRRIFPALILVLIATVALGSLFLLPDSYERLGKHVIAGSLFSSNFLLWSEAGYFDTMSEFKPLLHLWSLGIEAQFYILWPIILVAIWKLARFRTYLIAGIAIASFGLNIYFLGGYPVATFYSPLTRYWELMLGALLVIGFQRNALIKVVAFRQFFSFPKHLNIFSNTVSFVGIALIAASIAVFDKGTAFPWWNALIPPAGAVLVIAAGSGAWPNRYLLSNRIAVFIGLISYPLYLWHWPLLTYLRIYMPDKTINLNALKLVVLCCSLIAAELTYRLLEAPLRNIRLTTVAKTLGLLSLVPIVIGGTVVFGAMDKIERLETFNKLLIKDLREEVSAVNNGYRTGACFLNPGQTQNDFSQSCRASDKTEILLWGDSYAASLYPGLRELFLNPDEQISQYTASACPPAIDFDMKPTNRPNCRGINKRIFSEIKSQRPDVIILAASWQSYYERPNFMASLEESISQIKAQSKVVILIGPLIVFPMRQVEYVYPRPYLSGRPQIILDRGSDSISVPNSLLKHFSEMDRALNEVAIRQGVKYVSPISSLCSKGRCPVILLENSAPKLLSWDLGHLTRKGSSYYTRTLIMPFLKPYLSLSVFPKNPYRRDTGTHP